MMVNGCTPAESRMASAVSIHAPIVSGEGTLVYQSFHNSPSVAALASASWCSRSSGTSLIYLPSSVTGSIQRLILAALSTVVAIHEQQALEQAQVLFVLEQRAMQRRDDLFLIGGAQRFRANILGQQQLQPIEQFRCRRFLLQARHIAQLEETLHRGGEQFLLDAGKMHLDDLLHRRGFGEFDVVEKAAAQERVRQFFL